MKNKIDVLSDLIAGKTDKCCENCKYFKFSESKLNDTMDGDCELKNDNGKSFCFVFEVCDEYESINENILHKF